MPSKESVRSVEEWLELPELSAPRIRSERDDGAVVTLKVGFVSRFPRGLQESTERPHRS
jgi:hypothetical protein